MFAPVITVFYLFIAARFFMAAVDRQKARAVFGMVCLAALVATAANVLSLRAYLAWKSKTSSCMEQVAKGELGTDPIAESMMLKDFARNALTNYLKTNEWWDASVRAEGRALLFSYHLKKSMDTNAFNHWVRLDQRFMRDAYCADGSRLLRRLKATKTHTFYSSEGERLLSFSITPADCQW
jgi:hypothetical protein